MKRCRDVLEEDDLLLGKSSDSDLNDRDAAVTKEGESNDEVEERDSAVDQEECDEEAEAAGAGVAHEHFRGVEVIKKICHDGRNKDDKENYRIPVGQGKCHESHEECSKYRKDRERSRQAVYAVCGICGIDRYDEENYREDIENDRIQVEICACDGDIDSCAEEMDADECSDEGNDEVKGAFEIFIPGIYGSVIEPACDHCGEGCDKAHSKAGYFIAALEKALI